MRSGGTYDQDGLINQAYEEFVPQEQNIYDSNDQRHNKKSDNRTHESYEVTDSTGQGVIIDDEQIKMPPKRKGSPRRIMTIKEDNSRTQSFATDNNSPDRTYREQNSRVIKVQEIESPGGKISQKDYSPESFKGMRAKKKSVVYDEPNSDDRMFCFVRIRPILKKEIYQKKSIHGIDLNRMV